MAARTVWLRPPAGLRLRRPGPKEIPLRVLVTGGAGFIGSAVCRHLVAAGDEVLNLDLLTYAATLTSLEPVAAAPGYRFVKADIRDAEAVRAAFAAIRPDK